MTDTGFESASRTKTCERKWRKGDNRSSQASRSRPHAARSDDRSKSQAIHQRRVAAAARLVGLCDHHFLHNLGEGGVVPDRNERVVLEHLLPLVQVVAWLPRPVRVAR